MRKKIELGTKWGLGHGKRCIPAQRLIGAPSNDTACASLTTAAMQESEIEASVSLHSISMRLNEMLLFHGTSRQDAYSITRHGFHIQTSEAAPRFGQGAYFSDDVS